MFDIISTELENFRSFVGHHRFTLPSEPGLYALIGAIPDKPHLDGNGAGKSSLLEAIYWCLFGRTTRGLRSPDVHSWGAPNGSTCIITVKLNVAGEVITIARARPHPEIITLNGCLVEQGAINKALRLNADAFTYAVLLPQFGDSFFDLTPANKLALFSQIMELDFWLDKSQQASVLANEISQHKATEELSMAKLKGIVLGLEGDLKALQQQELEFATTQKGLIKGLIENLNQLKIEAPKIDKEVATIKGLLASLEKKAAIAVKEARTTTTQLEGLFKQWGAANSESSQLLDQLKALGEMGAKCPTCLQPVDQVVLRNEKARVKRAVTEAELATKRLDKEMSVLQTDQRAKKVDMAAIAKNQADWGRELTGQTVKQANHADKIKELTTRIMQETARLNPYSAMLDTKRGNLAALQAKIAACMAEISRLNEDHAAVSYWVSGFKRVRLFIVEETLRQFELEVNNNLTSLGLTDWQINFDVERENKSGGVTKGFMVFVLAPGHKEPVKWEAFSGGETQRLRLAGDLGLANLIMERAGLQNRIELYDEPSAHMGTEGLQNLAETLAERASLQGKRILIVDHHMIQFPFAGVIKIIKDSSGSHIFSDLKSVL